MKRAVWFLASCLLVTPLLAQPQIPALNWVARSDWVNVKTDVTPAAAGNGVADDTAAIQKALDGVRDGSTVYLPAGTYRITNTLTLRGPLTGVLIVGHGRDTKLVWDGGVGGTLFLDDGAAYSRFVGMVLDGRGRAAVGFCHFSQKRFETEVRHQHTAFLNFTDTGLLVDPKRSVATAETLVENCLFENCRRGSAILQFNEYDFTYDGCEFRRCETGIQCAHGNFYIRNCHFEASSNVDILAAQEHGCSIRRCTSVGSKSFISYGNPVAPLTIQDCRIEGWTNPDGAISLGGAPVIMFDCVFTKPPGKNPPVKILKGGQRLIVSQNVSAETGDVLQPGHTAKVYVIPAGKRRGIITSAHQSFTKDSVPIPTAVFDARRDFGAKGDGATDDTVAIQKAIDAARTRGKGAVAYLPSGYYVITDTLRLTGADYYIGGSGFRTQLVWKGREGGTMVAVNDPQRVTLEHLAIGNHDSGQMNNAIDVLQTSSGKPSFMTYDNVSVFGMYQRQPFRKGLWLRELSKDSVVLMPHVQGNVRIVDSARATILVNTSYEGSVVVEGKDKRRDGFLGFLTRLGTSCTHGLYVKDNHSIVMSDFYVEQADNGFVLEGSAGNPPGRVTIQGAKLHFNPPRKEGEENTAFTIRDYGGSFFFGHDQFYVEPTIMKLQHSGQRPLDMSVYGTCFYNTKLDVHKEDGLRLYTIGNDKAGTGESPAEDTIAPDTLAKLAVALDDLRVLGELDLRLNHFRQTGKGKRVAMD